MKIIGCKLQVTFAEISWVKIYEVPPYARRLRPIERELMLRPQYPQMYRKSEIPPVNSLSREFVVIDGTWKVGDLVDWFTDGCYWSAKVIKVFSDDDKVQVRTRFILRIMFFYYYYFCFIHT